MNNLFIKGNPKNNSESEFLHKTALSRNNPTGNNTCENSKRNSCS